MKVLNVWLGAPLIWQLANSQNAPSAPSAEDFVARREPAITILDNHLYITGGSFSQLVNGEIALNQGKYAWPLNDTLSISLKESWVNSTVEMRVTEQKAPSFNRSTFLRDPEQRTAYLWGGPAVDGTPPKAKGLWQLTANEDGGGEWSQPDAANVEKLVGIARTMGASAATCNGKALYLGGYELEGHYPTPGLVTYEMETRMWDNVSAAGLNVYGTSIYGAAACAENFGRNGLFFLIGGYLSDGLQIFDTKTDNQYLIDMANLTFYDVEERKWHAQQTSGDIPDPRERHCVVGAQANGNGTYEMSVISCSLWALTISTPTKTQTQRLTLSLGRYVYGGNRFTDDNIAMIKSDLYVLSIPGFVWFRANTTSEPRSSHACIVHNRQMIVVGGTGTSSGANLRTPDAWAKGLGVLDLPSLSWKNQYDADAGDYEAPQAVADWYANGGLDSVVWDNEDVKALFITSDNANSDDASSSNGTAIDNTTIDDSSSSNAPIIGGVVGGVLAAVLAVGTIWFFMRRRRRQRAAETMAKEPLTSSDRDTAGYDPAVSQNHQPNAVEINNNSVPYHKQQPAMGNGPYEMGVEHEPHETLLESRPSELGTENNERQELPSR